MHSLHNDRRHPYPILKIQRLTFDRLRQPNQRHSRPDFRVCPDTCQPNSTSSSSSLNCDMHCLYLSISEFSTRYTSGPFFQGSSCNPERCFSVAEVWPTQPALFTR